MITPCPPSTHCFPVRSTGLLALAIAFVSVFFVMVPSRAQTFTVLYTFRSFDDGARPLGDLSRDLAGNLYGATFQGGVNDAGTVYKVDVNGRLTVLHRFTGTNGDGAKAEGLTRDKLSGTLYGATYWGGDLNCNPPNGCGTVFRLDKHGKETLLHTFDGTDGAGPNTGLLLDKVGALYGATAYGGDYNTCDPINGCGVLFKIDNVGQFTALHAFMGGTDGVGPSSGDLLLDKQGNIYGTTAEGGGSGCVLLGFGCGTVYKVDSNGNETILHRFTGGGDGNDPRNGLILDGAGNLYGPAFYGGQSTLTMCAPFGCGTVFKITKNGNGVPLYRFKGGSDGANPTGGIVRSGAGDLYGVARLGGDSSCDCGTVYKLERAGNITVLHTFTGGADGANPSSRLLMDSSGNLYGTTAYGGDSACDCGVVFKITP